MGARWQGRRHRRAGGGAAHLGSAQRLARRPRRTALVGGHQLRQGAGNLAHRSARICRRPRPGHHAGVHVVLAHQYAGPLPAPGPGETVMVPSVAQVLNGIARAMLMDLLPQTTHAYGGQTLQLGAALTMMCAQEFDRAAARLVEENRALAALFADAAPVGELQAADADVSSLLISALQERNGALRALLVRLHEHVELIDTPQARALEERIWKELAESVRRRQLDMAM